MVETLGTPIAQGNTAEIFSWEDGYVLKLFRESMPAGMAAYEARCASTVHAAGLPVPEVGELIEIRGRMGLLYKRVDGPVMADSFVRQPWKLMSLSRLLAELHAEIHRCHNLELPSHKERLAAQIAHATSLPVERRDEILRHLETLNEESFLCHGDFHPGNILMTKAGPIIIDWMDATVGDPMADVARTSLLFRVASPPPGHPGYWLLKLARGTLHKRYLERYVEVTHGDVGRIEGWIPVLAAARLSEHTQGESDQLLALVNAGLPTH